MSEQNPYSPPTSGLSPEEQDSPYERTRAPGSVSALISSLLSLVFNIFYPLVAVFGVCPAWISIIFCFATPVYSIREYLSACRKQIENPDFFKRPSRAPLVIAIIALSIPCLYIALIIAAAILGIQHRRA